MTRLRSPWHLTLLWTTTLACGGGDGKTGDESTGTATGTATATGTGTDTTTSPTTGATTAEGTTTATTSEATTEPPTTDGTSTDASTTDASGTGSTTTGDDLSGFERFNLSTSAGPCAPGNDCDGFVELLASRTLRVEPFGEPGDPVVEVEISEEDFTAAVAVFADPALTALLDGDDPLCDPPTDIFESMLVEIDGSAHDATTTGCDQPPLAAARDMASSLVMKYAP